MTPDVPVYLIGTMLLSLGERNHLRRQRIGQGPLLYSQVDEELGYNKLLQIQVVVLVDVRQLPDLP
jgi:hypothetical protein